MTNRRSVPINITEPTRASDAVIQRCRMEIESPIKRLVRKLFIPYLKWRYKASELGEGFHWPKGRNILIGSGSRIGRYTYLGNGFESHGPICVGDLCMISTECKIVGSDHIYDVVGTPTRLGFPQEKRKVTTFGLDVWVGARVTIIEGVTIGDGAVVGSGALVTRDVLPYSIVGGVPAKIIRYRFNSTDITRHVQAIG